MLGLSHSRRSQIYIIIYRENLFCKNHRAMISHINVQSYSASVYLEVEWVHNGETKIFMGIYRENVFKKSIMTPVARMGSQYGN